MNKNTKIEQYLGKSHVKHSHTPKTKKILILCIVLTGSFMLVELFGGLLANSMALIADSMHMFSDLLSMILAFIGIVVSGFINTPKRTYGYSRFEIVISFANALLLVFICGIIVYKSIERFINPPQVDALTMIPIAIAGLLINCLVLFLIHKDSKHDHNSSDFTPKKLKPKTKQKRSLLMQGVFLHVASDLLGSAAAITSGMLIYFYGWVYMDPILSIFIVLLLINSTWRVIRDSTHILIEGAPSSIDPIRLKKLVEKLDKNIINAHHIHIWMLNEEENIITLHVVLNKNGNVNEIINKVKLFLINTYDIKHSTVQAEFEGRLENCNDEISCHDLKLDDQSHKHNHF